jgi:S-DNA-T family DNA segregation ATPase FtsK/SpoIIIE
MFGESSPKPSLKQEALAVIGFALALFLLASLLSYTPEDPSFGQYNTGEARNWVGTVGAHVAALLFDIFGLAVFWSSPCAS